MLVALLTRQPGIDHCSIKLGIGSSRFLLLRGVMARQRVLGVASQRQSDLVQFTIEFKVLCTSDNFRLLRVVTGIAACVRCLIDRVSLSTN